ncbi:hybrid sensor histidine kinase/response regulator [Noviherbaspirillum pedocola]|uniref:histidine kinase n=1 Tax=Noviherbaspirillum pedocola TaxID=2801341 RepID=A0A934SX16_9BURK|nr:PAS domain-containing protein [Noviherbaspirillum pedocola]MBK4737332.1 PAS domain-containing protein [Noviherbaspirillum pedocola]
MQLGGSVKSGSARYTFQIFIATGANWLIMNSSEAPEFAFLSDGGGMGELMRKHNWVQSPLGSPASWPQSLRTVVGLLLHSKFPMFVAWGPELSCLYNDPHTEILGTKHPAALGLRLQDIWAEIWDDIHPIVVQAMQGNATYHENLPLTVLRRGAPEQAWFTFSYSPVHDESGKVAGMFCAVVETTDQVLGERHRVEELVRLRQLVQKAPGFIAVLREPSHVFEIANDAYLQLIGHRDIIGKPVQEALPELEGQGFFEILDRVYATGEPFIGRELPAMLQRQPEGRLEQRFVSFVYQPTIDHRGNVSGIFVEGSDVTETVRAHQALRESEQRLRQLANTIPQLAWMANPDGWIHWYNDRWYEYTGTSPEEMAGWGWQKVHHPNTLPAVMEQWKTAIASGEIFEASFPLRAANGEYRTFMTRAAPLRDTAGNIVQWFGANTDVTPIEQAQHELREANHRKDEFLAMLAHELRNPLAPITSAANLLKAATLNEVLVRKTSQIISRQAEHMAALIDDLLDVSRVTRGLVTLDKRGVSLNSVLTETAEQVRPHVEARHHHFELELPADPLFVQGDRTRLIQVFSNLLHNAAKYTPEGGHIALNANTAHDQVVITVSDDGVGIRPALLPYIFELFTQAERSPDRSQGGLGLGLALVKSLVELHGGQVAAHSEGAGKGSVFTVCLPQANAEQTPLAQSDRKSGIPRLGGEKRILVVDDNKDAAEMLSLLLEAAGYAITVAYSAHDALSAAQRDSPSILFLDIGLPDMDGYALARKLRSLPEFSRSLLVAVTGYGQPEDRDRALQAGFNYHLVKPVKMSDVLNVLTENEYHGAPTGGTTA